jgi:gluconolactonase
MRQLLCFSVLLLLVPGVRAQDMPLSMILLSDEGWHPVAGEFASVGGLAAGRHGELFVANIQGKQIDRLSPDGERTTFARPSAAVAGMCFGPDDQLYACQPDKKQIVILSADGKETVVARDLPATDLVVSKKKDLYCTIPAEQAIYLVRLNGEKRVVDRGIATPAGITLWVDQGTLVVGDAAGSRLFAFRIGAGGDLDSKEGYYTLRTPPKAGSGVSQLIVDRDRRLYAASTEGVQVFDPTGRMSGVLLRPKRAPVTAVAFGGAERDRLYVVCDGRLFVRKTKARGIPPQ